MYKRQDEHIWTSVRNAEQLAKKISDVVTEKDNKNKSEYENKDVYKRQVTTSAATDGISDEVVAVISAAVATMYGSSEKARIKSIKTSSDGGRSAWAKAGVLDKTRPF